MVLESDTAQARPSGSMIGNPPRRASVDSGPAPLDYAALVRRLPNDGPSFVASAPRHLDVIGGLSDYSGSLVLGMPLTDAVQVAVQRCREDTCSVLIDADGQGDAAEPVSIPMSRLFTGEGAGAVADALARNAQMTAEHAESIRCVFGTVAELKRTQLIPKFDGGVFVSVRFNAPETSFVGRVSATAAAAVTALAGAWASELTMADAAGVCRRVAHDWLGEPVGHSDAASVLGGQAHTVNATRGEIPTVVDSIELPDDLMLVGIDCEHVHPDRLCKYEHVRAATLMGRSLIEKIIQHDGDPPMQWDGSLASVSVADYVNRFRDRLPTKLTGSEYLDRFGEIGDAWTRIDPAHTYRVRSRTEHHIYEHARSIGMLDCLKRSIVSRDRRALLELGDLMYASHWSYGQRCGLGSVETDYLVSQLRTQGVEAGVYGAKITGLGSGGVVAVFLKNSESALSALESAMKAAHAKSGRKPVLLRGSSPGALVRGVERI